MKPEPDIGDKVLETDPGDQAESFSLGRGPTRRQRARSGQTKLRWILRLFMLAAIVALALQRGMPTSDFGGLAILLAGAFVLPVVTRLAWVQFGRLGLEGTARWVATGAAILALLAFYALSAQWFLDGALG